MCQHIPDSRYSWPRLLLENILRQSAFPMPKRKAVHNQPDSHGNILKWLVLICSNMHYQYNITVDLNYLNKITQYRLKNIQLNEVFFMYLQPNRCTISEFMAIKYSQISSLLFSSSLNVVGYIICVATYGQSMLTWLVVPVVLHGHTSINGPIIYFMSYTGNLWSYCEKGLNLFLVI